MTKRINGFTDGLRQSLLTEITELYSYETSKDEFLPIDFAEKLSKFTAAINREISVYIDRNGKICDISIGQDTQIQLPNITRRTSEYGLSKIRCIHTHPNGSSKLSPVDISALQNLRLDAICAIGVDENGFVTGVSAAFLNGYDEEGLPIVEEERNIPLSKIPQVTWMEMILSADSIMKKHLHTVEEEPERVILIGIESEESLDELAELCDTAGGLVVGRFFQNRTVPDKTTYFGSGRIEELALEVQSLRVNLIISDDELTTAQVFNIQQRTGCRTIDRTALILDIFARRAVTAEGKLQVELAQLNYQSSHLIGKGLVLSRLGGGIGTRGPGETKLEVDRRRIREKMTDLRSKLKILGEQRKLMRKQRTDSGLPVVALVGYTNVGKSTLLNLLSASSVFVEDRLFATLDPVSRKLTLPDGNEVILVDSVGFIRKLPTELVEAFKSTLEEAALADLLVIVSDASSEQAYEQHQVVEEVLAQLGAGDRARIEVLNKCDQPITDEALKIQGAIRLSAKEETGIDELLQAIEYHFAHLRRRYALLVPFSQYALLNDLRSWGIIELEEHKDTGTYVVVQLDDASFGKLSAKFRSEIKEV